MELIETERQPRARDLQGLPLDARVPFPAL